MRKILLAGNRTKFKDNYYMKHFYTYLFLSLFLVVGYMPLWAQRISVSAPSHVAAGENFRIAYTVNTQDVSEFRGGNVPEGLEIVAGPYASSQSSFTMVNGHTTSSSSVTYTYTLYAEKDGHYTISGARAVVNGKRITSGSAHIHVSGRAQANGGTPNMQGSPVSAPRMRPEGSRISGNELFIRVTASKRRVHEQEPVLLTYKVYTTVDLTQLEGKMPDLNGFHTQEVQLPQQKTFHIEKVNGRPYRCVTWSEYVMYPQMTGDLKIPSITFKGIVEEENRNVDPFEAFFNGGSDYVDVKKSIIAPGMTIHVAPLPPSPSGFSGGVGKFNITAQLNKKEVQAGEPITLRVVIGGIGNIKLLKQPVVNFPKGFDTYDAKVTDKTKLTANGVEGNMIYDFLAVPRNQGKYTIPSVKMTYYDVTANAYKTIQTQPFVINVSKGDGNESGVTDFSDMKDQDIHPLKLGSSAFHQVNHFFFGSVGYLTILFLLVVAFVALLIIFRKRAAEMADMVKMRGKKANKIARRRLRRASLLMVKGRQAEFYDEVLRALWGYISDKLNMPVEQLTRENIQDTLSIHQVDKETIDKFVGALDECEFERYAPGDPQGNMERTFDRAMTAIMNIEDVMKKGNKNSVNR
jgi:hypothetical protein